MMLAVRAPRSKPPISVLSTFNASIKASAAGSPLRMVV
jgi:hypothetical protein